MNPDCFFFSYIDKDEVVRIGTMCVDCYQKDPEQKNIMFWEGSQRGYKPDARFVCKFCGSTIHEPEKN